MKGQLISKRLQQIIEERIKRNGPLTFAEFMQLCLYHPQYGYYSSGRARRGREGDYFTSPTVHPIFGALLGKQLVQMWRILGEGKFDIVEAGAGEGYLCYDLLGYLKRNEPQFYNLLHYHMVEVSPLVIERQREFLASFQEKVTWYKPDQISRLRIEGCFLSNELLDSFPVHRVVMEAEELKEIYVDIQDGALREVTQKPSTAELEGYFRRLGISLAEGQRAEVNLEALRWLRAVARGLKRGFVITIDYGYLAQELFSRERRNGTILCYRGHTVSSDPYIQLGLQDITSHVDFTSLILWGQQWGLRFAGLVPQYKFLLALGILEEVAVLGEGKEGLEATLERLTVKNLILPGAMGETFKVLIQHKEIESPQLDGLREPFNGGEKWLARRSSAP
ncbi:MAG: SAM-dependent methyltransferase [Deltaproteobacteria bacterium]|nr:MAG: SAM-dependent methyltransferase [Deltaproteobacteria bacterium]